MLSIRCSRARSSSGYVQGTRVKIATVRGGNTAITDAELFAQVTAPADPR
ncbi:MAG TPA: hypothetical protein VHN14_28755 [Kofleriaceae bacterium]|jgi:hypothetical protein|nr:hypothetical protein [Kofleriaceae bacterium]